jgi:hypothetical protein
MHIAPVGDDGSGSGSDDDGQSDARMVDYAGNVSV